MSQGAIGLDVVIFGGGAAGLWLLDELVRRGDDVLLLEADDLGSGQTIASQGIIHGGLKYTLSGLMTPSARAIREMPLRWRRSLAGEMPPDLRHTRVRSEFCYLWRTAGLGSRLSMLGARVGLRVAPSTVAAAARPDVLASCPEVARIEEQVIEPGSFLADLADRHRAALLRIDAAHGLELVTTGPGEIGTVRLINPETGAPVDLEPRAVVFTAGLGNERLRTLAGIDGPPMQRRPLHMVMLRGELPWLNGHCVDGAATRVTITSTRDCEDRVVWQLGGQIAETGTEMDGQHQIDRACAELDAVLPALDRRSAEWATYEAIRAEGRTPGGRRPDHPVIERVGSTLTAWPTKLALVPRLVEEIVAALPVPEPRAPGEREPIRRWPRPAVALPPWEQPDHWREE
ncbi:MAG: FAD-dependent oxidoreductase [Planctomycetota bacterium]|jgi:glycine/D-amino acid oxidase-like deaminating enzyme